MLACFDKMFLLLFGCSSGRAVDASIVAHRQFVKNALRQITNSYGEYIVDIIVYLLFASGNKCPPFV